MKIIYIYPNTYIYIYTKYNKETYWLKTFNIDFLQSLDIKPTVSIDLYVCHT